MVTPPPASPALLAEAREFLAGFRSLQLATANVQGEPLASYAPYALLANGSFGLLLSDLAAHTANLRANPRASLLCIAPEAASEEIFARKRLVLQCSAVMFGPGEAQREQVVTALAQRFGATVMQLASLPDFHGVVLKPLTANYVTGFARAQALPVSGLYAPTAPEPE
ncbi:MAG: pyridoxamine 5'-phosphate oxidase family protein [Pseudomonadales bacterium]